MRIKVSIVVPVFNASQLIKRCLNSVLNQKGNYELEIITIDDGSTDHSIDLVKSFEYPIKIIQQTNQGPAAARNKGIEAATGDYLAFLDADDYWLPGFLEQTVAFLEKNKEAVAVSVGQIHKIPGKEDRQMPQLKGEDRNIPKSGIVLNDFFLFWAEYNHVCTGSVLMRTAVVKQTGGQRPELRITEDLEFWAYLATFGKWGFIPETLLITDGGNVVKKNGYYKKNLNRWKNAPTIENWEKRIKCNLSKEDLKDYEFTQGKIASMLMYSYIQTFRIKLAHNTTKKYGAFFPKGKLQKVYNICKEIGYLAWWILSLVLITREIIKSFRYLK